VLRTEDQIRRITETYIKYVEIEIRVDKVILFGSYANATATENSDVDIAISSPDFGSDYLAEWKRLYRMVWRSGVEPVIEPRPLTPDMDPFMYSEITSNGVVVYEFKNSNPSF
jgi:uncharacterized protein